MPCPEGSHPHCSLQSRLAPSAAVPLQQATEGCLLSPTHFQSGSICRLQPDPCKIKKLCLKVLRSVSREPGSTCILQAVRMTYGAVPNDL